MLLGMPRPGGPEGVRRDGGITRRHEDATDEHRDEHDGDADEEPAAFRGTAGTIQPLLQPLERVRGRVDVVDLGAERVVQLPLVHASSPSTRPSAAMPRDEWDFTEPVEMPSVAAMSVSGSSA